MTVASAACAHSALEHPDEQDDEGDVEDAGECEEHQRRARVADRADDGGEVVEEQDGAGTEKTDLGEHRRVGQELGGRVHQRENGSREKWTADGQDRARDGGEDRPGRH